MNSCGLLRMGKLTVALVLSSGLLLAAGSVLAGEHDHHHQHAMDATGDAYTRSLASYVIPDLMLVDMHGKAVSLREGLGGDEPVMLNFIFTTCTAVCPVMSATFQQVQGELGDDGKKVRMVSISIDPEHDTPQKLRDYAGKYHAGPQWQMLTGSSESSIDVQRAFGTFRGDKMNHAPATFIRAGGADQPWLRLEGFASAKDIVREYRQLVSR